MKENQYVQVVSVVGANPPKDHMIGMRGIVFTAPTEDGECVVHVDEESLPDSIRYRHHTMEKTLREKNNAGPDFHLKYSILVHKDFLRELPASQRKEGHLPMDTLESWAERNGIHLIRTESNPLEEHPESYDYAGNKYKLCQSVSNITAYMDMLVGEAERLVKEGKGPLILIVHEPESAKKGMTKRTGYLYGAPRKVGDLPIDVALPEVDVVEEFEITL